jgi:hypothetical protein
LRRVLSGGLWAADLDGARSGRLRRNQDADLAALRAILARDSDEDRVTDAFRTWLLTQGWTPAASTDRWTDNLAFRAIQGFWSPFRGEGAGQRVGCW